MDLEILLRTTNWIEMLLKLLSGQVFPAYLPNKRNRNTKQLQLRYHPFWMEVIFEEFQKKHGYLDIKKKASPSRSHQSGVFGALKPQNEWNLSKHLRSWLERLVVLRPSFLLRFSKWIIEGALKDVGATQKKRNDDWFLIDPCIKLINYIFSKCWDVFLPHLFLCQRSCIQGCMSQHVCVCVSKKVPHLHNPP